MVRARERLPRVLSLSTLSPWTWGTREARAPSISTRASALERSTPFEISSTAPRERFRS